MVFLHDVSRRCYDVHLRVARISRAETETALDWTDTMNALFLAELVCGFTYLHCDSNAKDKIIIDSTLCTHNDNNTLFYSEIVWYTTQADQ